MRGASECLGCWGPMGVLGVVAAPGVLKVMGGMGAPGVLRMMGALWVVFGMLRVLGVPGVFVVLGVMGAAGTAYGAVVGLMAAHSAVGCVNLLDAQSPQGPGDQFIPFSPCSLSDQKSPGAAAEHCPCFMKC